MIKGVDISHWQGVVDFKKLVKDGNQFCIAKATDGLGGVDPMFNRNRIEAKKAGLIFGAYHWFHPSQDILKQVGHYVNVIGKRQPGELPPTIDWEPTTDTKLVGIAATKQRVKMFLDELEKIEGVTPMIYCSPGFVQDYGDLSMFASNPLWIAHYGVNHPRVPAPWKNFTIWQYTDKGGLDLDLFNGTIEDLKKLAA